MGVIEVLEMSASGTHTLEFILFRRQKEKKNFYGPLSKRPISKYLYSISLNLYLVSVRKVQGLVGGVWSGADRKGENKAIISQSLPPLPSPLQLQLLASLAAISMQQGRSSSPLAPGHWIRYLRYGARGSGAPCPLTPWIIWDSCFCLGELKTNKTPQINKGIRLPHKYPEIYWFIDLFIPQLIICKSLLICSHPLFYSLWGGRSFKQ